MRHLLLAALLLTGLGLASGQPGGGPPPSGSNYDPPPQRPAAAAPAPAPATPDKPFFSLELDWSDKSTYLKMALLLGSVLLVLRTFRKMNAGD